MSKTLTVVVGEVARLRGLAVVVPRVMRALLPAEVWKGEWALLPAG